ncbi:MAG: hypothetical protein KDH96_08630, partial [Candidatus Riesia sp.]|nr:hypothetical protein [Candidatus Riesia sp.]
ESHLTKNISGINENNTYEYLSDVIDGLMQSINFYRNSNKNPSELAKKIKNTINDTQNSMVISSDNPIEILKETATHLSLFIPKISSVMTNKINEINIMLKNIEIIENSTTKYFRELIEKYVPTDDKDVTNRLLDMKKRMADKYIATVSEIISGYDYTDADNSVKEINTTVKKLNDEYEIGTNSILDLLVIAKDSASIALVIEGLLNKLNIDKSVYKNTVDYNEFEQLMKEKMSSLLTNKKLKPEEIGKLDKMMKFMEATYDLKPDISRHIGGARAITTDAMQKTFEKHYVTNADKMIGLLGMSIKQNINKLMIAIMEISKKITEEQIFDESYLAMYESFANALKQIPPVTRIDTFEKALFGFSSNTNAMALARTFTSSMKNLRVQAEKIMAQSKLDMKDKIGNVLELIGKIEKAIRDGKDAVTSQFPTGDISKDRIVKLYKKVYRGGSYKYVDNSESYDITGGYNNSSDDSDDSSGDSGVYDSEDLDESMMEEISMPASDYSGGASHVKDMISDPYEKRYMKRVDIDLDKTVNPSDIANLINMKINMMKSMIPQQKQLTTDFDDYRKRNIELTGMATAKTIERINKSIETLKKDAKNTFTLLDDTDDIHTHYVKYYDSLKLAAERVIHSIERLNLLLNEISRNSNKISSNTMTSDIMELLKQYTKSIQYVDGKFFDDLRDWLVNLPITVLDDDSIPVHDANIPDSIKKDLKDNVISTEFKQSVQKMDYMIKEAVRGGNPLDLGDPITTYGILPYINRCFSPRTLEDRINKLKSLSKHFIPVLSQYTEMFKLLSKITGNKFDDTAANEFSTSLFDYMTIMTFFKSFKDPIPNNYEHKNESYNLLRDKYIQSRKPEEIFINNAAYTMRDYSDLYINTVIYINYIMGYERIRTSSF